MAKKLPRPSNENRKGGVKQWKIQQLTWKHWVVVAAVLLFIALWASFGFLVAASVLFVVGLILGAYGF